ncbi:MAG: DUF4342 domain-containing protein [Candidatus Margulisbacteria bacterium]|nr:DUF4342 domain-containing protein [Candidatus Margulisiibacteriota bacterium]
MNQEECRVRGCELFSALRKIIKEGNVRRIVIKDKKRVVMNMPMTLVGLGLIISPVLIGAGFAFAYFKEYKIIVERDDITRAQN